MNLSGSAEILLAIDSSGNITESKVSKASRPEFGQAALEAAVQWTFQPAIQKGQPVPKVVSIPFVFNSSFESKLEEAMGRTIFQNLPGTVISAESLPKIPVPRQKIWPKYPESLRGSGVKGSAVVAFVIDQEGRVINPEILRSTDESFVLPTLATALTLQFSPVLDPKGNPLLVSMIVQYDFDESMLKEQEKAKMRRILAPDGMRPRQQRSRGMPEMPGDSLRPDRSMRR